MANSSFPSGGLFSGGMATVDEPLLVFDTPSELTNYALLSATTGIALAIVGTDATIVMDIDGLVELTVVDTEADYIPIYDSSAGETKKILPSNLGITSTFASMFSEFAYVVFDTNASADPTIVDSVNVTSVTLSGTLSVAFTSAFTSAPTVLIATICNSTGNALMHEVQIDSVTTTAANVVCLKWTASDVTALTSVGSTGSFSSNVYTAATSGGAVTTLLKYNASTTTGLTRTNVSGTSGFRVALMFVGSIVV